MKMLLVTVEGTQQWVEIARGASDDEIRQQLDDMYEAIGCESIEIVRLRQGCCMIVDECGAINGSRVNICASALYGAAIYGNVLIGKIVHSPDGDLIYGYPSGVELYELRR